MNMVGVKNEIPTQKHTQHFENFKWPGDFSICGMLFIASRHRLTLPEHHC